MRDDEGYNQIEDDSQMAESGFSKELAERPTDGTLMKSGALQPTMEQKKKI